MEKGDPADRMSRQTQETLIPSADSSPREKTSVLNEKDEASSPPLVAPAPVPAPKRTQSAWSRLTGRTSRSTSPVLPTAAPAALPGSAPAGPVRSRSLDTPIYVGGEHPHVIGSMDRTLSHQPAAASLFGGVSPDAIDHEEGLVPVRSREEAEQREEQRQKIAADPWSVKFEPGEKINPKVSHRPALLAGSRRARRFAQRAHAPLAQTPAGHACSRLLSSMIVHS